MHPGLHHLPGLAARTRFCCRASQPIAEYLIGTSPALTISIYLFDSSSRTKSCCRVCRHRHLHSPIIVLKMKFCWFHYYWNRPSIVFSTFPFDRGLEDKYDVSLFHIFVTYFLSSFGSISFVCLTLNRLTRLMRDICLMRTTCNHFERKEMPIVQYFHDYQRYCF